MEKKMEPTIMGYIRTTILRYTEATFIPSQPESSLKGYQGTSRA